MKSFFINNIYDLLVFLSHFIIKFWRYFIDWSLVRFSSLVFPSLGWEVFHQQHDPWSREFPKQKSNDNNHPELHPGHLWPSMQRLTKLGSYLWLRFFLILHTQLPMHSTPYTFNTLYIWLFIHLNSYILDFLLSNIYVPARKTFHLGIYVKSSICQGMQLSFLIVTVSDEEVGLSVGRN